jgi:YD repeat-containing protein
MRKNYFYLLCTATTQLLAAGICSAQSTTLALKAPLTAIVVDGNAQEWGDSLSYYNPEKKVHYTIANDKDNLYLVVKTKDPMQQDNILNAGITFSIDTKGRKKSAYSTTFPEAGGSTGGVGKSIEEKTLLARFTKVKKIGVNGFKDVSEDEIATTNDYGIHIAMDYDQQGNLIYEEAIPLALFHAGDLAKNEWSFNIKINGMEAGDTGNSAATSADMAPSSIGRGGRGGSNAGRTPAFKPIETTGPKSQSTQSIDFWGKFTLSKAQ